MSTSRSPLIWIALAVLALFLLASLAANVALVFLLQRQTMDTARLQAQIVAMEHQLQALKEDLAAQEAMLAEDR